MIGKKVGDKKPKLDRDKKKDLKAKLKRIKPPTGEVGVLAGIVPDEKQEAFTAWVSKRSRVLEILGKKDLTDGDKQVLEAAYKGFEAEQARESTALEPSVIASTGAMLAVSSETARGYLEVYSPEQLGHLATMATEEGADAKQTVETDLTLLLDGSYPGREKETRTLTSITVALSAHIAEELERHTGKSAVSMHDVNLDNAWDVLLAKHKRKHPDDYAAAETAAAVEYKDVAMKLLDPETTIQIEMDEEPFRLDHEFLVEVFKLLNYDREDIHRFAEFVRLNFEFTGPEAEDAVPFILAELLCQFCSEEQGIMLNQRSDALYRLVRTVSDPTELGATDLIDRVVEALVGHERINTTVAKEEESRFEDLVEVREPDVDGDYGDQNRQDPEEDD